MYKYIIAILVRIDSALFLCEGRVDGLGGVMHILTHQGADIATPRYAPPNP
jgi:hypothetical protein